MGYSAYYSAALNSKISNLESGCNPCVRIRAGLVPAGLQPSAGFRSKTPRPPCIFVEKLKVSGW